MDLLTREPKFYSTCLWIIFFEKNNTFSKKNFNGSELPWTTTMIRVNNRKLLGKALLYFQTNYISFSKYRIWIRYYTLYEWVLIIIKVIDKKLQKCRFLSKFMPYKVINYNVICYGVNRGLTQQLTLAAIL